MARHRKYHVRHHRHRRRNPFGISGDDTSRILWGSVGYVAARAVPAMALPSRNSGLVGYALNAGTAFALKLLVGGSMGDSMFVGGVVATVTRIVSDNFGAKIQGLSGDPQFTMGAYWQSYFAIPTVSDAYGRVAASPYPQPALPATLQGYGGPRSTSTGRYTSGRFG